MILEKMLPIPGSDDGVDAVTTLFRHLSSKIEEISFRSQRHRSNGGLPRFLALAAMITRIFSRALLAFVVAVAAAVTALLRAAVMVAKK